MTAILTVRNIFLFVAVAASLAALPPGSRADEIERQLFRIPGTDYDVLIDGPARRPNGMFAQPLLAAIAV
jgi:hypothetical protein